MLALLFFLGCTDSREEGKKDAPTLPNLTLLDPSLEKDFVYSEENRQGSNRRGGLPAGGSDALVIDQQPAFVPRFGLPNSLGVGFTEITGALSEEQSIVFDDWNGQTDDEASLTFGIFADLDHDGIDEVIAGASGGCQTGECPRVFRVDPQTGSLAAAPELLTLLPPIKLGSVAAFLDLDGNGHEDILMGFGTERIFLADNAGEWQIPKHYPPPKGYPYPEMRDKGAMTVTDLDENGLLDVLVGDSTCEEESVTQRVLFQVRPGIFEPVDGIFGPSFPGSPDAILATPLGPKDGYVVQMVGRPCSSAEPHPGFYRRIGWSDLGYPEFEAFDPFDLSAHFKEFSAVSFGPFTIAHPMGATVGDLNLDGHWDSIVTYSTPKLMKSMPLFGVFMGTDEGPFEDWSEFANAGPPANEDIMNQLPWGNALIDLTGDGLADLITAHGPDWEGLHQPSNWAGLQDVTLHVATDFGYFEDATELLGEHTPGHWRSLAVGDLEKDGDADFIVGGYGILPKVLRNDIETGNGYLALRLKGHTSNSLGVGAVVKVNASQVIPNQPQLAGHIGSPLVVSEPMVFAGLGPSNLAGNIRVEWPSGVIQEVENLAAGKVHVLHEPPLFEITPASRLIQGNGKAILFVTPRSLTGELDLEGKITASIFAGDGKIASVVATDSGWEVAVLGPESGGSVVIEVSRNGVPYGVRPRIFWEVSEENSVE